MTISLKNNQPMTALTKIQILLVGHAPQEVAPMASALMADSDVHVSTRVISNGHTDPLYGLSTPPDILVLWLNSQWRDELQALANRRLALRPPTITIGPRDDPEILRLAMRSGARDYLTQPVALHELQQAIQRVIQEKRASIGPAQQTIAVIDAKGGSGATLLANNLAHIMAARQQMPVALLDLDIQFGAQALCLDLRPTRDVVEALNAAGGLDTLALEGYMTKHHSGLHLLAAPMNRLVLLSEVSPDNLTRLLEVVHQTYTRVVIDLPRLIDTLSMVALTQASRVVVVMQQTLAGMRDARRLLEILQRELEIPRERLLVAVNRYNPKHPITVEAIRQTLQQTLLALIPNDYARVEAAANQGVPLFEFAPTAAITRALTQLARQLSEEEETPARRGLLGRALSLFAGKPA